METAWIGAQKKVFTRWANTHLVQRGLKISDIDNDLRTGSILISLVEILSGEAKNSALREGPIEGKIQKMGNAAKALKYIESKGINLVNCRPEHIVDNNTKMVLGLLWRIITKYHIQPHLTEEELVHESGGNSNLSRSQKLGHFLNKTTRDALLRWCRTEVEAHNIALANFTKSFQNTAVLAALVHRLRADLLNLEEIANMEPKAAFMKIFSVAESGLQIPHLLDPEDLLDGHADECSVMAYVAYFLNYKRGASVIATPDVAVAVAEASTSQSSASASASASAQSNDLVIENAKLKANNDSFREHIKRELESIYQTVETHVSEITTATDTKINSVARKMLKLENTISKLSDLAESAKQSLLEQEDEKGKATAEVEKEWEAVRKEKEELAKERAQIEQEREELAKAREAFTKEQEQAKHDKEKKRERKNRVTVELPAEQPTPVHKPAEDTHVELSEELDISTDDLNSAAEALRSSVEEPVEEKAEISAESQPSVPAPVPEPEPEKPQAEPEKIEPQMPEKEMEDITDSKKIVLVQSFVRRWRDRRNYRFAKRRRDVVLEIVNTEKNYIHCLQMMTQEYFQPLRDIAKDKNLPLSHTLNENMLKTIFSNVEVILNINTILLKKLQQRWDSWHYQQKIGDVFLSMIEFLKCYNQYVNHYNRSLDALAEAAKSPAFVDFIKAKSIKNGKELRDLLIVPIQRIPRYVILLEEARKSTERTHPDYTDLSSSVTKMQSIADYVNEKKRDYEALAQVTAVQEMLVGISILEYTRLRYITEGELSAVLDDGKKTAQVHVFLFNELFICCKQVKKVFGDRKQNKPKYKFKNMITFTVDTKVEPKFDSMFVIEANQERHQFITKTNDRDVWVKHMKDNIEKLIEGKKTKVDRASKSLG